MEYTYTKYPVNVSQLSDEILTALGLFTTRLYADEYVDGSINYSDANRADNLITDFTDALTVDQLSTLDTVIDNHVAVTNYVRFDWSIRRDVYSPFFYAIAGQSLQNWGTISYNLKMQACIFFYAPYNLRLTVISDSQDSRNWDLLLGRTKQSRESCVETMRVKVGQYMRLGQITLAQTQDFYTRVYEFIIWFNEANKPDFKQWLTNEVGSPYENNGFAQMPYYSVQMKDDLMLIYNGNYNV